MSSHLKRLMLGLYFFSLLLSGCGGAGIKSTSTADATAESSEATDSSSSAQSSKEKKSTSSKYGHLKKRKVPGRPHPNPVINKAFADNLMAARKKEALRFLKQGADADTIAANGEPVLYTALRVGFNDIADEEQ